MLENFLDLSLFDSRLGLLTPRSHPGKKEDVTLGATLGGACPHSLSLPISGESLSNQKQLSTGAEGLTGIWTTASFPGWMSNVDLFLPHAAHLLCLLELDKYYLIALVVNPQTVC